MLCAFLLSRLVAFGGEPTKLFRPARPCPPKEANNPSQPRKEANRLTSGLPPLAWGLKGTQKVTLERTPSPLFKHIHLFLLVLFMFSRLRQKNKFLFCHHTKAPSLPPPPLTLPPLPSPFPPPSPHHPPPPFGLRNQGLVRGAQAPSSAPRAATSRTSSSPSPAAALARSPLCLSCFSWALRGDQRHFWGKPNKGNPVFFGSGWEGRPEAFLGKPFLLFLLGL